MIKDGELDESDMGIVEDKVNSLEHKVELSSFNALGSLFEL